MVEQPGWMDLPEEQADTITNGKTELVKKKFTFCSLNFIVTPVLQGNRRNSAKLDIEQTKISKCKWLEHLIFESKRIESASKQFFNVSNEF